MGEDNAGTTNQVFPTRRKESELRGCALILLNRTFRRLFLTLGNAGAAGSFWLNGYAEWLDDGRTTLRLGRFVETAAACGLVPPRCAANAYFCAASIAFS
jgi:hypothetical protein